MSDDWYVVPALGLAAANIFIAATVFMASRRGKHSMLLISLFLIGFSAGYAISSGVLT